MAKVFTERDLGLRAPQDIQDMRQSSFDYHETMGQPVLFKHRWNLEDFQKGLVPICPLRDDIHQGHSDWDKYCFGTGFLGGYADAQIVFVTIADVAEDVLRFDPQGVLIRDQHPGMVAPWLPKMGDGDLIILAEFDSTTWEVLDEYERYTLKQVTPTTIHGFRGSKYIVNQRAQIDRVPVGDPLYDVPITFDYNDSPEPIHPDNYDPDTYPVDSRYTEFEIGASIRGEEPKNSSHFTQEVKVAVQEPNTQFTQNVKLIGHGDVQFHNL